MRNLETPVLFVGVVELRANSAQMVEKVPQGIEGLKSQSRRPITLRLPRLGLTLKNLSWSCVGGQTNSKRAETASWRFPLCRFHSQSSLLYQAKPLIKYRRKIDFTRYQRSIPGERVQMDTCKIAPGNQYTAVDDCTRYQVLRVYPRRTANNTLDFVDCVLEEMPFPIQRIQTDRGREFFAVIVQDRLKQYGIKFRPNKPASPHLNGKVERSQKTDKIEFYRTIDLASVDLDMLLAEWQHYYNWKRPHSAHKGKTSMERYCELMEQTPLIEEVANCYQPEREHIQEQNYRLEMQLKKLKRCL